MTSTLYRSFLRVLEKWPTDPSKKGRDLGEYIRHCVGEAFRGAGPRDPNKCQEIQESLSRIVNNKYKEAFYVSNSASASGLSQAECQQIVSNEFLQLMKDEDKSRITVLKEKVMKTDNQKSKE